MIISGGVNVYPAETEVALELASQRRRVRRWSACPIRSGGERIVAAVVPKGEVDRGRRCSAGQGERRVRSGPEGGPLLRLAAAQRHRQGRQEEARRGVGTRDDARRGGRGLAGRVRRSSTPCWRRSTTTAGSKETPADGWDTRDTVGHLADTNDVMYRARSPVATRDLMSDATRGRSGADVDLRSRTAVDAFTAWQMAKVREMSWQEVYAWWQDDDVPGCTT